MKRDEKLIAIENPVQHRLEQSIAASEHDKEKLISVPQARALIQERIRGEEEKKKVCSIQCALK